MIEFLNAGM
jgi:hypothetical protein